MPAKILIVDDESDLEMLIRQKFRRQIREQVFELYFAQNGLEALTKLDQHPEIDLVVTDINMPQMDGLTLLVRLHEVNPIIKAIIVSAYGDMENIRTAMNRGAFDFITKPINFEDLEITIHKTLKYVTQLKNTIRSIQENNILRMYVDENVLNFMTRKEFETNLMSTEMIEGSVAFIDICGFTALSEKLPPHQVVQMLNHCFDIFVKKILENGGYVDKFIGDAVLAVFKEGDHRRNAARAAVIIRDTITGQNVPDHAAGINVSIGINAGVMISGNIGSESLRRLDHTVIGDTVNTASRYQATAEAGQIIIDESFQTYINSYFTCRRIGEASLKNKANPVIIYNIIEAIVGA